MDDDLWTPGAIAACREVANAIYATCHTGGNITDAQAEYVAEVTQTLVNEGFRVQADLRNEKIGYKIREHTLQKVPYLLVVGDREKENGLVAVRVRSGEDLGSMALADFAQRLRGAA